MYLTNFESRRSAGRPEAPINIVTEADESQALLSVEDRGDGSRLRPIVVLSDFDLTLCDTYGFDPLTNNHIPLLDQAVVDVANKTSLVVATARRSNHPFIPELWRSGLVAPTMPVITENGGVLSIPKRSGETEHVSLVPSDSIEEMVQWAEESGSRLKGLGPDQRFITKLGNTVIIARVQDSEGNSTVKDQEILMNKLLDSGVPDTIEVSHTGSSLSIQPKGVSKAQGFLKLLERAHVGRHRMTVVGMGDSPNDESIFREADLSIGVDKRVKSMVNLSMNRGVKSAAFVLAMCATQKNFDLAIRFKQT